MTKHLIVIIVLVLVVGLTTKRTEAQSYDKDLAVKLRSLIEHQEDPPPQIEVGESFYDTEERLKRETEVKVAPTKLHVATTQKKTQKTITTPPKQNSDVEYASDCWSVAEQVTIKHFGAGQWPAMRELINRESGCNVYARNPKSGACGIPQALPCSKMQDKSLSGQLEWMASYIKGRYGTPGSALSWHNKMNWY